MAKFLSWFKENNRLLRAVVLIILPLAVHAGFSTSRAGDWRSQPMLQPQAQYMPLLPFLDYYIDENLSMDVEEPASPSLRSSYQPLALEKLPRTEGIVWLRFMLAPLPPDARAPIYLLDMGQSVPGIPKLYDPVRNELSGAMEWRENVPGQRNILLLPEQGSEPITCYIRLDGLPGPWFSPIIRSPQNAAGNWSSLARTGAILALAVVMVLCLLRGVSEKGQWRIWTALFVGATLAQAIVGMPTVGDNFRMDGLVSILLPGIALMLLPHVGRHLMRTPVKSRSLDIQLILLSLPGAAFALLPLVPGWDWLDRWLDLWPVGTAFFIPTALAAWIMGLAGSRRFLLGSVLPPVFVGISLLGLDFGFPPTLLAALPLWGIALCSLLIAGTKMPDYEPEPATPEKGTRQSPELATPPAAGETIINLDHPLDDPNLRIIEPALYSKDETEEADQEDILQIPGDYVWQSPQRDSDALETALREPLDDLMRQGAALGECALPPAARSYAENMLSAGKRMGDILSGHYGRGEASKLAMENDESSSFNLRTVVRKAHDSIARSAENAGDALSWYMPPNMDGEYYGNCARLEQILCLLLENAVRATSKGVVSLTVEKRSVNGNRDEISFTVTDNGQGYPPQKRSSLALSRAWEMAGESGGYLDIDSGPDGTSVTFSAKFVPAAEDGSLEEEKLLPHVILACEDDVQRRELGRIIETLPCRICEARSMEEALDCQRRDSSQLLITAGRLALPSSADMVRQFVILARDASLTHCHVLAITRDRSQWGRLKSSGFTHAMLEPVDPDSLRGTVSDLMGASIRHPGFEGREQGAKSPDGIGGVAAGSMFVAGVARSTDMADNESGADSAGENAVAPSHSSTMPERSGAVEDFTDFTELEWLGGKISESESEEANSAEGESGSGLTDDEGIKETPQGAKPESGDAAFTESVGAPVLASPQSDSLAPDENQEKAYSESSPQGGAHELVVFENGETEAGGSEWVGEPIPLESRKETPLKEEKNAKNTHGDDSLMDFIVSVKDNMDTVLSEAGENRGENETSKSGDTPEKIGHSMDDARENARVALAATRKNSSVSAFVNSSVELVSKAFSAALANTGGMPKNGMPEGGISGGGGNSVQPASREEKQSAPEAVKPDPAISSIVNLLDHSIGEAIMAFERKDGQDVARYTGIIARESNAFGLRSLARMAQCVERAAKVNDLEAIGVLLPELANSVERNRIGLTQKNIPHNK